MLVSMFAVLQNRSFDHVGDVRVHIGGPVGNVEVDLLGAVDVSA